MNLKTLTVMVLGLLISPVINAQMAVKVNSLQSVVNAINDDPLLRNASMSFYALDLNTGDAIAELNPEMSLIPASTMKLVTTATALEMFGPYFRFKTEIIADGRIDSTGVLHGNLRIRGGGDPTLGSKYFKKQNFNPFFMEKWVEAIKAAGIDSITGRVIGDARLFDDNTVPSSWSWGDMGNYYGASANGLSIYDNMCTLMFESGSNAGDSTTIQCVDPFIPEMTFQNSVKASNVNRDNAYVYGGPYDPNHFVEGTIPKGKEEFGVKASIHDPAYVAAFELERTLIENGIYPTETATTIRRHAQEFEFYDLPAENSKIIHEHQSPYLTSILYWVNMVSVNLFAEHLLYRMGAWKYGTGNVYNGTTAIERHWSSKGVDVKGMYQNDGSGLSRANAISAKHLTKILKSVKGGKYGDTFLKSLPVAGKSGTLRSIGRGTSAAGNIQAKSGSMTRVRSYAGYATTKSGRKVAFAVIVNNFNCTGYQMKKKLEQIIVAIANFAG